MVKLKEKSTRENSQDCRRALDDLQLILSRIYARHAENKLSWEVDDIAKLSNIVYGLCGIVRHHIQGGRHGD